MPKNIDTVGYRLKLIRGKAKYTAEYFAKIMDIKPRTYWSYERNETNPPIKFLQMLAEKFNVDLHWLLTGKNEPVGDWKTKLNLTDNEASLLFDAICNDKMMFLLLAEALKGDKTALSRLNKLLSE